MSSAATITAIDEGVERRYNRTLFSSSIMGLIKRMAKNGQALHVNKALDLIERLNAQQAKLREVVREVVVKQQEAQSKEDKTYQYKCYL